MKRGFFVFFSVWIAFSGLSGAQPVSPPLLKARLKIEGVKGKADLRKIREALLSVPGVKKVDFKIPKRLLFFKDYEKMYTVVEFERGTLTSETLIQVVEGISRPYGIYKVKFLE